DGLHEPEMRQEAEPHAVHHLVVGLVLEALHRAAAPRVVHEHIDAAEARDRRVDGGKTLRLVAHVAAHEEARTAEGIDLGGGRRAGRDVDLRDHHGGALACEAARDPAADAEPGAGDEGDASVEATRHAATYASSEPVTAPREIGTHDGGRSGTIVTP